ncbi:MAG: glycosyltransferase family 39 protein [Chloroflexi bacterium]|nr:glycosyltransferase family 39 protein [Chloroflexota bacterium]
MNIKNKPCPSWLPNGLAVVGAILYLMQSVAYAHTTVSSLDEGSYLIKGLYYLNGVYEPFEPYGPLTNKAPFAFLIPGMAEFIFGAGLRTGRYFSIFLGLLTLLGTWIVARRWAGAWMAALSAWVFALSPMIIKLHARAVSEVIIACLLAWICVLLLDEKPSLWQIVLASVLAAVAVFTRQNMAPILPLLILYTFWQHGKQNGIWAFLGGSIAFLAFHIYYWPRVLTIWSPWLPEPLTPFLDAFRVPTDSVPIWDPSIDFWNRINAFFQGFRYHFIPLLGSLFGLILFPLRLSDWKSASAMRTAGFLAVSFFTLVLMHGWASLASQYESYSCVFCFSNYLGFFDPLGILFFVIAFSHASNQNSNRAVQILLACIILLSATGIGFSLFEQVGNGLLNLPLVPRLRSGGLGFIAIVDALTQGFDMPLSQIRRWISSSLGFIIGTAVLLTAFFIWKREKKTNLALTLANSFLITGFLLSPILHLGESKRDCETDIIRDHEKLGAYLASIIPPESLVYWDGGNAYTPMIYVPQARIFPPQINDGYTFHIGGDPDALYYFSHWNAELDQRWRAEADVFIIEAKRYNNWKDFLTPREFQEFLKPIHSPSCVEGSELRIFQRLP